MTSGPLLTCEVKFYRRRMTAQEPLFYRAAACTLGQPGAIVCLCCSIFQIFFDFLMFLNVFNVFNVFLIISYEQVIDSHCMSL